MWPGLSGRAYKYWYHPLGTKFVAKAGSYILARVNALNQWEPLYIGEADSLASRCGPSHEKWDRAIRLGATHIHAHTTAGERHVRLAEETDLRRAYDCPCNDQ